MLSLEHTDLLSHSSITLSEICDKSPCPKPVLLSYSHMALLRSESGRRMHDCELTDDDQTYDQG